MILPSRRTLISWAGSLIPALATGVAELSPGAAAAYPPLRDAYPTSATLLVGAWLSQEGVMENNLAQIGNQEDHSSPDIKESFRQHNLVEVSGFFLPAGFCRHCLAVYRSTVGSGRVSEHKPSKG
jgi:hypothetical protein